MSEKSHIEPDQYWRVPQESLDDGLPWNSLHHGLIPGEVALVELAVPPKAGVVDQDIDSNVGLFGRREDLRCRIRLRQVCDK